MLVLTRNQGQSIIIQTTDREIEITIANLAKSGQVKVAIAALDDVATRFHWGHQDHSGLEELLAPPSVSEKLT